LTATFGFAQDDEETEFVFRPTIGLGVGMMNYYGDLSKNSSGNNPIVSRLGYDVRVSQRLNPFLDLSFYMLLGKVGANERSIDRNLNFESRLTSGGIALFYNFDHLLKEDRVLEPYVSIGFESLEFLSKTDLLDRFGNPYYYWTDGSIRNLPELEENQETAIRIQRDYNYESDIRSENADGFGDYAERTWAIPFGVGASFLFADKFQFKMGTSMHFTFTDYIDGVTEESVGVRKGDKKNDRFLFSTISISYDLTGPAPGGPDFSGPDKTDTDLDSIADFMDDCPATPVGVQVDDKGCPLDNDGDGVADYLDKEANSPEGAHVDSNGVALSDLQIDSIYLGYTDETGAYTRYTNTKEALTTSERKTKRKKASYAVQIGEYTESIDSEMANQILSLPDAKTRELEDGTIVIEVGNYENLPDALKRKGDLESAGTETSGVVVTDTKGETSDVSKTEISATTPSETLPETGNGGGTPPSSTGTPVDPVVPTPPTPTARPNSPYTLDREIDTRSVPKVVEDVKYGNKTVYRIQVGAFSRKLSREIFDDIPDLFVITTDDGLTRYYAGSFTSYSEAASRKIDLMSSGFEGAHVVAFKQGQKLSLVQAGATPAENVVPLPQSSGSSVNKGLVKFKVQIGAYSEQIPTDVIEKYMELGSIDQDKGSDGTTRYMIGEFDNYEAANQFKQELIGRGIEGAFVVGKFKGNTISAKEAVELLK